jgi:hypothetical protein
MRGQKRPQTERSRAIGIALVKGGAQASRETGIPEGTIYAWMVDPEFKELQERTKEAVAAEWWSIVQFGFRRVRELLKDEKDTQRAATATAIVTDKMLLLRGDATTRTETRAITDGWDDEERDALKRAIDAELSKVPGTPPRAEAEPALAAASTNGSGPLPTASEH